MLLYHYINKINKDVFDKGKYRVRETVLIL